VATKSKATMGIAEEPSCELETADITKTSFRDLAQAHNGSIKAPKI
jgi:hypothetical protein